MLCFDPPELEKRWEEAIHVLVDVAELVPFEADDDDDENIVITEATELEHFSMWSWDDTTTVTVGDCLRWAALVKDKRKVLYDSRTLRLPGRTVVHIAAAETEDMYALDSIANVLSVKLTVEGSKYTARIIDKCLDFSALVETECHEHYPSNVAGMFFVEVTHPTSAPATIVDQVVNAFLFELVASDISCAPRSFFAPEVLDADPFGHDKHNIKLRKPRIGKGLNELYSLFIEGSAAQPAEYALIHFVKAIEYVSATVVRQAKHDSLRRRLTSKRALAPDAEFLDSLVAVVEEGRVFNKDSEALRLTLQTCCDPYLLASENPPKFLGGLNALRSKSDPKMQKAALDELAASLSATRNQLSHAKANYAPTGDECPPDQLIAFTGLAHAVAEQAIRWYANLAEHTRVGG